MLRTSTEHEEFRMRSLGERVSQIMLDKMVTVPRDRVGAQSAAWSTR
jgi:hypothetical protein